MSTETIKPLADKDIATLTNVELVTEISRLLSTLESLQRENEALKIDASNHAADAETVRRGRETERIRAEAAEAEVKRYRAALYDIATNDEYRILTAEEAQSVAQKALASTGGEHHGN